MPPGTVARPKSPPTVLSPPARCGYAACCVEASSVCRRLCLSGTLPSFYFLFFFPHKGYACFERYRGLGQMV